MPKLKMKRNSFVTLQYVLGFTGEKEMNDKGKEVNSLRRLNGEESAQRRFFNQKIEGFTKDTQEETNRMVEEYNKFLADLKEKLKGDNKKKKDEKEPDYEARINMLVDKDKSLKDSIAKLNEEILSLGKKEEEIEVTDKTLECLKKYFKEFGDKVGFAVGDDDNVSEIEESLK